MKSPPANIRKLIQQDFRSTEFLEGLGSQQRNNERSPLVYAPQHGERLIREMHNMYLGVLCSCFRNGPCSLFEIKFVPA